MLNIELLIEDTSKPSTVKEKGDVVEAIIGELAESPGKLEDHTLDELLTYISFLGEQNFHEIERTNSSPPRSSGTSQRKGSPPKRFNPPKEMKNLSPSKRVSFADPLENKPHVGHTVDIPRPKAKEKIKPESSSQSLIPLPSPQPIIPLPTPQPIVSPSNPLDFSIPQGNWEELVKWSQESSFTAVRT